MRKKIMLLVIIICGFTLFPVKALGLTTSITGASNINENQQFTVTLNVINGNNIMGVDAILNYDSSKLTLVSTEGLNGYIVVLGTRLIAYKNTGNNGTFGFVRLTFRAKEGFIPGQTTAISLSDVKGSDGSDVSGSGSSRTIRVVSSNNNLSDLRINGNTISGFSPSKTSYNITLENDISTVTISATAQHSKSSVSGTGVKTLKLYQNVFNIIVTAENGSKKTYAISIIRKDKEGFTRARSNDTSLKKLNVVGFDIGFDNNVKKYELLVENNISKVDIEAIPNSSHAKVTYDSTVKLNVGLNVIKVMVEAESGIKKEYIINITRSNAGPTTTLEKLGEALKNTTSEIINVNVKDNNTKIDIDILKEIKDKQKLVIVNRYDSKGNIIYIWEINGKYIDDIKYIDVKIDINHNNHEKINALTNYTNYTSLSFKQAGPLPNNTLVSIFVGDNYNDEEELKLYYYDSKTNSIKMVKENLIIENGFVKINLEKTTDYFISMADLTHNDIENNNLVVWVLGTIIFLQTILILGLFLERFRKKNLN